MHSHTRSHTKEKKEEEKQIKKDTMKRLFFLATTNNKACRL